MKAALLASLLISSAVPTLSAAAAALPPLVPGRLDWDWIGNTHCDFRPGARNGEGRWEQNFIEEREVTADGTVAVAQPHGDKGSSTSIRHTGADDLQGKAAGYFQRNGDLGPI